VCVWGDFVMCVCVCMSGICNVWLCVNMGFIMCGFAYVRVFNVCVCVCVWGVGEGFFNVGFCIFVSF